MLSLLILCLLWTSILGSPLGDYEKELNKEGLNVEKIHKLHKEESKEVEEEFGDKETQAEIKKLRALYASNAPVKGTLVSVKTELEINGELAKDLLEGDILLTPEQWKIALDRDPKNPMQRRQALTQAVNLWQPMGAPVIPFEVELGHGDMDKVKIVYDSMMFFEKRTCVKFRPALPTDKAVLSFNFTSNRGCSSHVGMSGTKQNVNLEPDCIAMPIVLHEIAHALGVLNVQSRPDRDEYIDVDDENIEYGLEHNFMKDPPARRPLSTYGIPYEFGSTMHYPEKAFAKDINFPTIFALPQYSLYQYSMSGPQPTFYDSLLINRLYKCTDKCQNRISCLNNGVQDGADCNKCFCPRGWSGTNCERRPADAQITTVSGPQNIRFEIGDGRVDTFKEKLYIYQAPTGKRIEATVNRVGDLQTDDCRWFGVEIVTANDTRISGYKFCANSRIKPVVSESNTLLMWVYADGHNRFNADITLRIV